MITQHLEGQYVYGDDMYLDDFYMDEKWAFINGFNDYMISDKARVWSRKSQRFLKLKPMDKHGYLGVCLKQNGVAYYKYIHRLVAEAFIPNPHNYPIVRHLNDNPEYNEEPELAWGTQKDNMHDAIKNGRAHFVTPEERRKGYVDRMTPVKATNLATGESSYYESQGEAGRSLNIPQANIWKVMRGERRTAGGYSFEEVCDHDNN